MENFIPEQMDPLLENLHKYRNSLKGNFPEKVKRMDILTSEIIRKQN